MKTNLPLRIARMEAIVNQMRSRSIGQLEVIYSNACEAQDTKKASYALRMIRNQLLNESDAQMAIDRVHLDTSTPEKFVESLYNLFNGAWATYRQELRDLTTQEGFPFDVTLPTAPNAAPVEEESEEE